MNKKKKMPKFPDTVFYLQGCDIEKLTFISPKQKHHIGSSLTLGLYINMWTLQEHAVNINTINAGPYYVDEVAAIAQASMYIQNKLDLYRARLAELKK